MSVVIDRELPAFGILESEHIDVIPRGNEDDNEKSIKLALINLMPTKEKTELQFLRRISNTPFIVDVDFITMKSHTCKNTSRFHIEKFYKTFEDIKNYKYDAMIITGAPVENLKFEDVDYWEEFVEILEFAKRKVFSTIFVCWSSQAALYHYYGIEKKKLEKKLFGIYKCKLNKNIYITSGFDENFYVPHSRHTFSTISDVSKIKDIDIVSSSDEVGLNIAATKDQKFIFITGHGEYDRKTLELEYIRDLNSGKDISIPENYYVDGKKDLGVSIKWRSHSSLLFQNWINFCGKNKFFK